jgi:hypothetical protein
MPSVDGECGFGERAITRLMREPIHDVREYPSVIEMKSHLARIRTGITDAPQIRSL